MEHEFHEYADGTNMQKISKLQSPNPKQYPNFTTHYCGCPGCSKLSEIWNFGYWNLFGAF